MKIHNIQWEENKAYYFHDSMNKLAGDSITVTGVQPEEYNGVFTLYGCLSNCCIVEMYDNPGKYIGGGEIE